MLSVIDDAEIDIDSIDADGEIPQRTQVTLHLHGDLQAAAEAYMGIDEPDGRYGQKMVFILHDEVAKELHAQLTKLMFG